MLASPTAGALRPASARIVVSWSAVQPRRGDAPDWDARGTGGFSVRAQLRAVHRARERAGGGFEPVATFFSTPLWAARPAEGCLPPGGGNPHARAPAASALSDYRMMVESFLSLARTEGVPVRYLSAWNEPNSGSFLAPQRPRCSVEAPSQAAALYAPLVRALRAALDSAPGMQEVVVGEAASPYAAHAGISTVAELVEGLPRDVLCAGPVWTQHQYVGDADGVAEAERALSGRADCPGSGERIWVTETGAGATTPGDPRPVATAARTPDSAALRRGCRWLADLLDRWNHDGHVEAALQYTLRDDPKFPVGLARTAGSPSYPTYALWLAWGARGDATAPPPALPAACREPNP